MISMGIATPFHPPTDETAYWADQFLVADDEAQIAESDMPANSSITTDDLSTTAGLLVSSIAHEQNPKFQNSEFMGLMKRLRDREVIVEGNDMVDSGTRTSYGRSDGGGLAGWADQFAADVKGKGRALDERLRTEEVRGYAR